MRLVLGHISGFPAEELLAALVPLAALMLGWARITGRRLRHAAKLRR